MHVPSRHSAVSLLCLLPINNACISLYKDSLLTGIYYLADFKLAKKSHDLFEFELKP